MIIREAVTRRDTDRFIRLPWRIYRNDENWVPPLIVERRELLDPHRNPFFEHSRVALYLASDEAGRDLGRIAAVVNFNHIRTHDEPVGFFGLFECVDDQGVADALFHKAAGFLRSHDIETMRGPENLSVNDDLGLLVEGFDTPPMIMMPHNPPYYSRLIEGHGFSKAMDLYAYVSEIGDGPACAALQRGSRIAAQRYHCTIRSLDMKNFDADLERIHAIYNSAWEDNWGAVAMTDREFAHMAGNLKQVLDPDLCLIAEIDGETAGFSLSLPDFNQVLIRLNGRLIPFGILKILYYKPRIRALRVLAMGVVRKYRKRGIDSCLYYETFRRAREKGMIRGEMSWILENNSMMNRILETLGFSVCKKYRLYDLPLL